MINKICRMCGTIHIKPTEDAKTNEVGVWFNCPCGSTLLIPDRSFYGREIKRQDRREDEGKAGTDRL